MASTPSKANREAQRPADDDLQVFDIPALMNLFGLSKPSIYGLIKAGHLRTFKVGRSRAATGKAIRECQATLENLAAQQDAQGLQSNFQRRPRKESPQVNEGGLPPPVGGIGRREPRKLRPTSVANTPATA